MMLDKDDTLISVALTAGVSLVGICAFAAGYDSGFQQAMKQPQKPTVISGLKLLTIVIIFGLAIPALCRMPNNQGMKDQPRSVRSR